MFHRPAFPLLVLLLLAGCSDDRRSEVSGSVKLNGRDIEEGAISFIPVDGNTGPGAGGEIRNGKYFVPREKGVTAGKNRVELRAFRETGRKVQDPTGKPGVMTLERVMAFPPEYNDRSTLVKDVKPGSDAIDFDIAAPEPGR